MGKPTGRAERHYQGIVGYDRREMTAKTRRFFKTAARRARRRDGRLVAIEDARDAPGSPADCGR